jgi:hypothetical protein
MNMRLATSLVPWALLLVTCGPEKDAGESDTGTSTDATTGDTPTGATTGPTEATTGTSTGTTGDAGQPLFCGANPTNEPECVELCVRDLDPDTGLVEPNCHVTETRADMTSVELPACVEVMDSWQPPPGAVACFTVLVDRDGKHTPSPIDNMSSECVDAGHNAEIRLFRTAPMMAGACAAVTCEPSSNIMRDCPNL